MKAFETLLIGQYIAILLSNYIFIPNQRLQTTVHPHTWHFETRNYWRPLLFLFASILFSPLSFIYYAFGISIIMLLLIYFIERKASNKGYVISQLLQFSITGAAAFIYAHEASYINVAAIRVALFNPVILAYVFAYLLCLTPANMCIKFLFRFYQFDPAALQDESLLKAGRFIGNIERMMILTFVLTGQYSAIGFLVAAKSILRLKDDKKLSEYVLIGTFLSVAFAILTGIIVQHIVPKL
jgi:hypothetical protein